LRKRPRTSAWIAGGWLDLAQGLVNWRVCHLMGLNEVRRRYARSRLGQLWLTLSTGIMVATLGVVWSTLWKVPVADLLPFIATSLVLWILISGAIGEAATVFATSAPLFLNQGMSFSTAVYALVYRHLLIFLHNLPIVAVVMIIFSVTPTPLALWSILGMILLFVTLTWLSYAVAIACARFRDLAQLVQSTLLIAFFITPILWKPDQIPPGKEYILSMNPFAALLAVTREPLLGRLPSSGEWLSAAAFSIGGFLLTLPVIGYCQRRIVYWL